jgi:alpha-galactosidase
MTTDEYRAHFSLWSLLAAPLIAGNDLRDMKPEIHDILTNKEVIAVNQDPLGSEGRRVRQDGGLEVWSKQMQDGSRSVVLLNRDASQKEITVSWQDIGYPAHLSAGVRDLWQEKDLGQYKDKFSASVAPHSVMMVKVAP